MSHSESSLCNLTLEESDLKKLEELDPFQTDGYQNHSRTSIPVRIVYTDEKGKQTSDTQTLTFQILTRSVKTQGAKHKEAKHDSHLQSLRVCLSSQEDIFLSMASTVSNTSFEALKTKNELNLHFRDFPNSLLGILKNCTISKEEGKNRAELRLTYEGTGKLLVLQNTEYKQIELVELYFSGTNLEKAHQSIIYRYNFNRTKLTMIQNSIDSIYRLLAQKNPPLLSYIQKHVGDC